MDKTEIIVLILASIVMLSFILAISFGKIENDKQQKVNFFDCQQRTQDSEWCYSIFIK